SKGEGRGGCGHGEDDDVGAHVKHGDPGEQDGGERKRDREQRETGKARAHARQEAKAKTAANPRGERRGRDDHCELDHGARREPTPQTVSRWRGRAGSSSIFSRSRRTCTVTVPLSNAGS